MRNIANNVIRLAIVTILLFTTTLASAAETSSSGTSRGTAVSTATSKSTDNIKEYSYDEDIRSKGTAAWTIWVPTKEERTEIIDSVIEKTNQYRAENDLEPLSKYATLSKAGNIRAQEQALLFGHTRPDGSSWSTIVKTVDYKGKLVGENCAKAERNFFAKDSGNPEKLADLILKMWINSPGHNKNMLDEKYTRIGIGLFVTKDSMNNTTYYIVQMLGA